MASYNSALAPGTLANKRKQAEEYIRFALIFDVPYLRPTVTQACMFAQLLANKHAAPASIKNSISGAKSWIEEHLGSPLAFMSPQLTRLVKGFVKNSSHIPTRAAPLQPRHIKRICVVLDSLPSAPLGVKPAILIGYACFLRSSNLLSPTMQEWGGPHTLLAGDVSFLPQGIRVTIRSTKTRSSPARLTFVIPAVEDPIICPAVAWRRYKSAVAPWALGPTFIHMNRLPITPTQVVKLMRVALQDEKDISPSSVSMHSLRRGAAQAAVEEGVPLDEIMARGTWKSTSGMRPDLIPPACSV